MQNEPENTEAHAPKTQVGSVRLLKTKLWKAVCKAEELLDTDDKTVALKAINSLATSGGVWLKTHTTHDLEKRLEQLEKLLPDVKLEPDDETEDE